MKISTREASGVAILDVEGKVTIEAGPGQIHEAVRRLLAQSKKKILVNLKNVSFMDSVGVGTLVASYTTVVGGNGRMILVNASDRVEHVLSITNLLKVIETCQDERRGIARLSE